MIKIESLKNYVGSVNEKDFFRLATNIYMITDFICKDYPTYKEWYFSKQLPAIFGETRNILFVRNPEKTDEIISMACLKKDEEEQKICTLYVSDKYRGLGIGTLIIEKSMEWLGTTKPFITLADYKLEMFNSIIEKYHWELTEIVSGIYNDRSQELCFNGTLTRDNGRYLKQGLYKRLVLALNYRKEQMKS